MKDQLLGLYEALRPLEKQALEQTAGHFGRKPKVVVFLSVSNKASRAIVAVGLGNSLDSAWKNARNKLRRITPFRETEWHWLKADLVMHIRAWRPAELNAHLSNVRRNYFRQGVAFDPDFGHALLEQELNGIAAITEDTQTGRIGLSENRIRNYCKRERALPALPNGFGQREAWFTFDTVGVFSDAADLTGTVHHLQSGGNVNGIRLAPNVQAETRQLIFNAGTYLATQLRDDGSFNYGWFPTHGKAINTYNILRHCSTLYSMLEAWEATGDEAIASGVPRGIEYVLREALQRRMEENVPHAYVIDHANGGEIKLGAQAALILTIAKYTSLSGSSRFIDDARAAANAIVRRFMDPESGRYIHVLNQTDLSIKEPFRIIYYDGEATFALLRLYAIDPDPRWLNAARLAFDQFLCADYWKHHDHWLSYCTNEITRYLPEDRYFDFGLKNAFGNLRFIHDRETAFPTFLELLMAAAGMLKSIQVQDKQYLLKNYDIDQLYRTIEHRSEYQRASHFYPEMAMYFANPETIAGSFYIRHHSFRVRIDDVEHFISGYCQYLKHGLLDMWVPWEGRQQSPAFDLLETEPEAARTIVASASIEAAVLGEDVEAVARAAKTFTSSEGTIVKRTIDLAGGPLHIIDASHNAGILSVNAAFEIAALHPKNNGARRIALLGQMMLAGHQASELHRSLAQPVLAAGFDKVFTHGEEMRHLYEVLPESVRAGHFTTAHELADAAAACVAGGDVVLIKGDRRAADFDKVPGLLTIRLTKAKSTLNRTIQSVDPDMANAYSLPGTTALAVEDSASKDRDFFPLAAETRNAKAISQATWTAAQIEAAVGGRWLTPPPDGWFIQSVVRGQKHIDMLPGPTLYVASTRENLSLHESSRGKGASWDTHQRLSALAPRLAGAIVERPVPGLPPNFPVLQVEDPIGALITLGYAARERYRGKVVAVTGSAGKSSTVAMLRHILPPEANVHATIDNYNSRVGVPVMLASLAEDVDVCILEIAQSALWMNSGPVTLRARPHFAIITEIALTQTDHVKSVEDVARFKSRIFRGLEKEAEAIFNEDLPCVGIIQNAAQSFAKRVVLTGTSEAADVRLLQAESSDAGSRVRATVFGEDVTFTINVLGSGQVRNALNALAAVVRLGFDAKAAAARFPTYHPGLARLERRILETARGTITVIDDSWNATVLAMVNAFETLRTYTLKPQGRKIAVLGRIVHLGDMAQTLHRSLNEPLLATGFDHVVTHGDEMRFLREVLPQELLGPHFSSAEPCIAYLLDVCRNNDVILIKGSRRDSDFGTVGPMLIERLARSEENVDGSKADASAKTAHVQPRELLVSDAKSKSPLGDSRKPQELAVIEDAALQPVERRSHPHPVSTKFDENVSATRPVASVAIDLNSGEILAGQYDQTPIEPAGFSQLLLLMLCFEKLNKDDVQLQQQVAVSDSAARCVEHGIGLRAGQKLLVAELIEAIVVCNACDAALALAEHIFSTDIQCLTGIRSLVEKLRLQQTNLQSVTGQTRHDQQTTLSDIATVARVIFGSHLKYRRWFSQSVLSVNGSVHISESNLIASGAVSHGFFFGDEGQHGIALANIAGRETVLCVVNARDAFHRDYIFHALLASAQRTLGSGPLMPSPVAQCSVSLVSRSGEYRINLIGDTYFGEYYTRIRQRKGIQDALTRHGYDHSFKNLEPLIASGDYNIANFEAVLTEKPLPSFVKTKPYILAGDPFQSAAALQRQGFHAVCLGNNHAFDYGTPGLIDTLESFCHAGIRTFGAGHHALQAEAPLEVHCGNRKVVFFAGYQYRKYMEEDFAFYAMAQRPGVACLSGGLMQRLHEARIQDPKALLVVLPHWGFDFEWRSKMQLKYAEQFAAAGADLVIGHGAHMMQEIEQVSGRWVVYGIGNGVFNSNGEYEKRGLAPFSLFAQIVVSASRTEVRLYPLYCDNLKTDWQPRLVTEIEFKQAVGILCQKGVRIGGAAQSEISVDEDIYGKYLTFDVL